VQLLIPTPSSPFTSALPRALLHLSIDVLALAGSPEIAAHLPSNFSEKTPIDDVQLAVESLEVALVLNGGEVLVYRMADRQSVTARRLPDKQLVSLEHVPVADGLRFKPYFLVRPEAPVTAFAISDVGEYFSYSLLLLDHIYLSGFASVAYANGSLSVIDMRGPRVILQTVKTRQSTNHHSFIPRNSANADPVLSLTWAISGVKSGQSPPCYLPEKYP
jgi:syntaxin-binding protein 5